MTNLEDTLLFKEFVRRSSSIAAGPGDLTATFNSLSTLVQDVSGYVILSFPEYTPHDHVRHLSGLFRLSDRLLGAELYDQLGNVELALFVFGLYTHDWGMALARTELDHLFANGSTSSPGLLPGEPVVARNYVNKSIKNGVSEQTARSDYLRETHNLRSGARVREYLESTSRSFADAVAKVVEGHTLDIREIRDQQRYPNALPLFGETVNLAAITAYVRLVDLFDIADDRTPYALWKFVAPSNETSQVEWEKHRALSPVTLDKSFDVPQISIAGLTNSPTVFSSLADLRSLIETWFEESMALLRAMPPKYYLRLDSKIKWHIRTSGFDPVLVRFECDRTAVLGLLSSELYKHDPLAFVRELLQNSVDAIDVRKSMLADAGLQMDGEIRVSLRSDANSFHIDWSDNGIGMDVNVLASYFASSGRSWYSSREAKAIQSLHPISQFGIGVLSLFAASTKIDVKTRRGPTADPSVPGIEVEIPTRGSYFRIQPSLSADPVGTTIHMEVPYSLRGISKEAVCGALLRIARFVEHKVTINREGGNLYTGSTSPESHDAPSLSVTSIRGEAADILRTACILVEIKLARPSEMFIAQYSALIPRSPENVRDPVGHRQWLIEGKLVSLDDVVIESEEAVFIKGIQVGPVVTSGRNEGAYIGTRHSDWLPPSILLNVLDPALIEMDLSRSRTRVRSKGLTDALWHDIAVGLKARLSTLHKPNPAEMAKLLGTCALFGGVPDEGLRVLADPVDVPLLVIEAGHGTRWKAAHEFADGSEFTEAPFEIAYAASNAGLDIQQNALAGWAGKDMLFPAEGFSGRQPPYLRYLLEFGEKSLIEAGWLPSGLCFVQGPEGQAEPLVCRVWEKGVLPSASPHHWDALRIVCKELPQLLSFPQNAASYAGIGSRFWNRNHRKVREITKALLALSEKHDQQRLDPKKAKLFKYLTSTAFYDFVVPSRQAGTTLAIQLPNRLLELAEGEECACPERFDEKDFYPGTIGKYQNPYHYSLRAWERQGSRLGVGFER